MPLPPRHAVLLVALLATTGTRADRQEDIRLFLKGDFLFRKHCVACHGETGRGDGPLAKNAAIKPRNFRTGVFKFRSTPMGFLPTNADLTRTIRTGIAGSMMPPFHQLTDPEVATLIAYIKSLSRRWKDPSLITKPLPPAKPPAWFHDPAGAGPHLVAGNNTFQNQCAACHGDTGQGDGPASQGLKDAWGASITPAPLNTNTPRSGPTPGDLFRTVAMGLDGTPMTGHLDTLGPDKIWELVSYLQTLRIQSP